MKRKRRYLLFQLVRGTPFTEAEARALGDQTVMESLGEQGSSRAEYRLKFFNAEKQWALVQCALESQEAVIAAFALKRFFNGVDVALRLQKIFGTLQKALPLFPDAKPPGAKFKQARPAAAAPAR